MMRTKSRRLEWWALLLLPVFSAGCFTVNHSYAGTKPITNAAGLNKPTTVVKHFEEHDRQFFWLHGGIPTGESLNGLQLAADQIGDHDGIVNLELRDGQDLFDSALTHVVCLLSMLCGSWSTWVEGDVVDYSSPRLDYRPVDRTLERRRLQDSIRGGQWRKR